ncbi:hypothetical protein FHS14_001879 [Paenibacillus baekrokdamisoli]|nr:hypothetical protein [Paenibacillus baekrokdamisoli]
MGAGFFVGIAESIKFAYPFLIKYKFSPYFVSISEEETCFTAKDGVSRFFWITVKFVILVTGAGEKNMDNSRLNVLLRTDFFILRAS